MTDSILDNTLRTVLSYALDGEQPARAYEVRGLAQLFKDLVDNIEANRDPMDDIAPAAAVVLEEIRASLAVLALERD